MKNIELRMRIHRKMILLCYFAFFFIFLPSCYYIMTKLSNIGDKVKKPSTLKHESKVNQLEELIKSNVRNLSVQYKITSTEANELLDEFINNLNDTKSIQDYRSVWNQIKNGIRENTLFSSNCNYLGMALNALSTAKIIAADVDSRGTQLKLLLTLEGEANAVFKPQWYPIDKIISGPVYAGKDRFNAEIFAFFLSGLLDFRIVPFTVERIINLEKDIYPVATERLRNTIVKRDNNVWCVYGVCHYCKPSELACSQTNKHFNDLIGVRGALIYHIPKKLKLHRSPWQRKYKGNQPMRWQYQNDYCENTVKKKLTTNEILDLIDASIFDFLIQNGDRHHYETLNNKIVLLDNGKGLGNPLIHHLDILAPLYQCCIIRMKTWMRLLAMTGNNFRKYLNEFVKLNQEMITELHLNAIEERLLMIYSAVELCIMRFPKQNIYIE